jgi:hypothetical protein
VRHRAYIQTILVRTPQRTSDDDPLLVPHHSVRRQVVSPSRPSPLLRPFAPRQAKNNTGSVAVRFTHSPLLQPDLAASDHRLCVGAVASASSNGHLQADVSIERQFSRIFPAHPRSLASVLIPRPAALVVLLRLRRPAGFGFQKISSQRTQRHFPNLPKKHAFGLGSGAH